ncbi:SDR family NAD(P)-dependent oxidoreductase [Euzebya tangerina]|uniref:SDR family NAD(P)-dependent oxidoreductase n=1 Tax=Euzebya tangerina TaxID=591198 RepID=UPI000E32411D|nr:SDR family NAD(P)-dependent oxidoreductase [Euzebya tangerina]
MLIDRHVLITGASSGIGAACARHFSRAGADVTITGRRQDRLDEIAAELPGSVTTLVFDVQDRAMTNAALAEVGDVDVLVNNAGLASGLGPMQAGDVTDWDAMIQTNVVGLLNVTRAVTPGMVERGRGHIINIGSVAGREVYPGGAVYCASKHAVDALTKGFRLDLLGTGVKVSTVDPGMVETEFSVVRFHGDRERAEAVYDGMDPLTGDDVAEAVVWIADRPRHVQVAEILIFPEAQASATRVHRT